MDDDLPLTLAVVVNDGPLPRWVQRALAEVAAIRGVRLALILSHPPRALADEATRSRLGRLYPAVDQWWFPPPHDLRGPITTARETPRPGRRDHDHVGRRAATRGCCASTRSMPCSTCRTMPWRVM